MLQCRLFDVAEKNFFEFRDNWLNFFEPKEIAGNNIGY